VNREECIKADYVQGNLMSEIAREHGLSIRRIQQITQEKSLRAERQARIKISKQPISSMHAKLGRALFNHRYDLALTVTEAAKRIHWSTIRLRRAEKGFIDFTLMDVQDLTGYLDIDSKIFWETYI
jgi:hypothetical protein